jgi:hypothetical protein
MTKDFKGIEAGIVPEEGHPAYSNVMARMSSGTRHGLGVSIWLQIAYLENLSRDQRAVQEYGLSERANEQVPALSNDVYFRCTW